MILLGVPVLAGAFLLVEAGLEHIRAPRILARAAGTGLVAARAIAAVEFIIGVPSVAAVVFGTAELRWALAAQTAMYVAFAAHLSWRRYRRDESDCGCNRMGTQVGPGGIARAVVLAAATCAATTLYPAAALPGGGIAVLLVACAAVVAVLLYTLPAAVDGSAA
ncbi:MAG TPA: MauE/DoxX family redox-associated membrane protein [Pseudonocardiaceae bacterium]|nr:MauE/DoxX family redox-associated membrane protein [Pseudonocardiaceae bacterium]